jgi:photosystem II stability/assembly factor-like uncharacterized protein
VSVVQGEALAASVDGLFASADGAQTWTAVALPSAPTSWSRLAVAHAPSNPAVAYAWGATLTAAFLYQRSADGSWSAIGRLPDLKLTQAWYDWYIKVSPDNEDQIYLGAIDLVRGDGGDAGWTWLNLSTRSEGDSIHPDQHVLVFDPADGNTIYAGNDGGVFRSPDRGVSWQVLNDGLGITEVEFLAQDNSSQTWLVAGTQDNGTIRWTGEPGWEHVADGDGGCCGVDTTTPGTVFHTYFGMGMERSMSGGDFGSWQPLGPRVPNSYQALFYPPTEVGSGAVAQAGQSVFVSRDAGTSWTEVKLPQGVMASTLYLPNSDRVVAGTKDGRIFSCEWADPAWGAAIELTSPRAAWISDLYVDANDPNRAWVTYSSPGGGRLFRSDDGGGTWQDCSPGLPDLPINAVEVDLTNASRVWVAADMGVYESLDAGETWSTFGTGLPNVLVEDLLFHADGALLRCATRNRGAWQIAVNG